MGNSRDQILLEAVRAELATWSEDDGFVRPLPAGIMQDRHPNADRGTQ